MSDLDCDHIAYLERKCDDLLATNRRLLREAEEDRGAIREITSFVGHEHWDSYGTRGAHCPICIRYREWREKHTAAITRAHGQPGGEPQT